MIVGAIIEKLELAGYRFEVNGDTIRYRRVLKVDGEDPKPLLLALKARKAEALAYLRRRQEPHPGDCVCPDCLHPRQETPLASAHVRGADTGQGVSPVGTVSVMGTRARVYPMRPECLKAGGCLWLTLDCDWYVIIDDQGNLTGRCRERVRGATGEERARWVLAQLDRRRSVLH